MRCINCGVENKEDALFCKGCGVDLWKKIEMPEHYQPKNTDIEKMFSSLAELLENASLTLDKLYENVEKLKQQYKPNEDEVLELRKKAEKLEKENKIMVKQMAEQGKIITDLRKQMESVIVCPKCKKQFTQKVMFCSKCGTKLG